MTEIPKVLKMSADEVDGYVNSLNYCGQDILDLYNYSKESISQRYEFKPEDFDWLLTDLGSTSKRVEIADFVNHTILIHANREKCEIAKLQARNAVLERVLDAAERVAADRQLHLGTLDESDLCAAIKAARSVDE